MNIHFSYHFYRCSALIHCMFFLILSFGIVPSSAVPRKEVVNTKKMFSAKLDSIELEKQIRKRRGEPLDELESESRAIYDSIVVLRRQLDGTSEDGLPSLEGDEESSPLRALLRFFRKPVHIFDWIIVVVGLIAVLSGIILISGLVHTIFSRTRKSSRQSVRPSLKKSQSDYVSKDSSVGPPLVSSQMTDKDDKDITLLRKRMKRDIDRIQRFNDAPSPFSTAEKNGAGNKEQDDTDTLRDDIIRAAQEGLDAQDIARKYHVSVDQVALILRVAAKGQSKK